MKTVHVRKSGCSPARPWALVLGAGLVASTVGLSLAQPAGAPGDGSRRWPGSRTEWRERAREPGTRPPAENARARAGGGAARSYDGSGNNLANPAWGSAGSLYLREASGAHYADGVSAPAGPNRPGARAISNAVAAQGPVETADERGLSTCWYEFGQFLDHDLGLAKGGSSEAFDIPVPRGDAYFDPLSTGTAVIWFDRSDFAPSARAGAPRQQINSVSAFIDGSQIYGSDAARAAWLRSGEGGRLKSRLTDQGEMLPLNDGTQANDNPVGAPAGSLVVAGDVRANEQPGLTALHTLFLREHNQLAGQIQARNPFWGDEQVFQEARRIVIAELQVIVTREFLPAILGRELPRYAGYRPEVNPGISNLFATAGYRIGHSVVGPDIEVLDAQFVEVGSLPLAEIFFNPSAIPSVGGVDPFVRYFATAIMQKNDTQIVDALRNFLFGPPGAGGFDLAALNIQRGRDHGLANYNTVRRDFGLRRANSFGQITSNAALAAQLAALYGAVDDVDPWVGMLAEDHLPGASVGPTHMAVIIDQFIRLRDGDRFWYQNGQFPRSQLEIIESTRLSDIFRRTSGVARLQANVFFAFDLGAACPADFNLDGVLDPDDLSDFIGCFFAHDCPPGQDADFNRDGRTNPDDLADFIGAFFAGC